MEPREWIEKPALAREAIVSSQDSLEHVIATQWLLLFEVALRTGESPRTLLDQMFAAAPESAHWYGTAASSYDSAMRDEAENILKELFSGHSQ